MNQRPALSKGELEVARAIWQLGRATVGEVNEALSESKLDYTTIQTYIRRLEAKGYVRARRAGRNKIYSPKVPSNQVIKETVDDFLNRLFDGEMVPLVRHLVQDRRITPQEVAQLRDLLQELEARGDGKRE